MEKKMNLEKVRGYYWQIKELAKSITNETSFKELPMIEGDSTEIEFANYCYRKIANIEDDSILFLKLDTKDNCTTTLTASRWIESEEKLCLMDLEDELYNLSKKSLKIKIDVVDKYDTLNDYVADRWLIKARIFRYINKIEDELICDEKLEHTKEIRQLKRKIKYQRNLERDYYELKCLMKDMDNIDFSKSTYRNL